MDNDDWNFDYLDELMGKDEVPEEVKKDIAKVKEQHEEVKDKLLKKKKEIEDAKKKTEEFNGLIDNLRPAAEKIKSSPALNEPIKTEPKAIRKQLKEVEVSIAFISMFVKLLNFIFILI